MDQVVIGVDVGATAAKLGVVNRSGSILWQTEFSTQTDYRTFFSRIGEAIQKVQSTVLPKAEILGIGLGAPASNPRLGTVQAVNLNWGECTNFRDALSQHIGLPVILDNDANVTAIGEMYYGAAKGLRDFIMVTLGTGLGSGFVVNGDLVYGSDGLAGELGHVCVEMNGRDCACGRQGCLETYVSASGLKRTVFELMARRRTESTLRDLSFSRMTARAISEAAEAGDALALEAFEYTGKILGLKLADAVAHTSPEAIILFGGMANAGDFILEPARRYLKQFTLHIYKNDIPVILSALPGSDAAVLGAAALAWKKLESSAEVVSHNA
jgi:glucokinase